MSDEKLKFLSACLFFSHEKNYGVADQKLLFGGGVMNGRKGKQGEELEWLDISDIRPPSIRVRNPPSAESVKGLASSIEESALLQPIVVREAPGGVGGYEVVCGERRLMAFEELKRKTIPAVIIDVTDKEVLAAALVENLQREALTSEEREAAIVKLWNNGNGDYRTQKDLADKIGLSQQEVSNILNAAKFRKEFIIPLEATGRRAGGRGEEVRWNKITAYDINETAGLEPDERIEILRKVARDEIPSSGIRKFIAQLKDLEAPFRGAVISGELSMDQVKNYSTMNEKAREQLERAGFDRSEKMLYLNEEKNAVSSGKSTTTPAKSVEEERPVVQRVPVVAPLQSTEQALAAAKKEYVSLYDQLLATRESLEKLTLEKLVEIEPLEMEGKVMAVLEKIAERIMELKLDAKGMAGLKA